MSEFSTKGAALMMQQQGRNDGVGLPTLTLPDPAAGGGGRSRRSMRRAARQGSGPVQSGPGRYQVWRQSLSEALRSVGAWSLVAAVAVIVAASPVSGPAGGVGRWVADAADTGGSAVQAGLGLGPDWGWLQTMAQSDASWVFIAAPVIGWLADVAKRGGRRG